MRKEEKATGLLNGLLDFLKGIEELQTKGFEKSSNSEFSTSSGKKGIYDYGVKIGALKKSALSQRPRKIKEETVEPENIEKEPLVDIFDKDNYVLVVAELPNIKEKDLDFKIVKNVLKINAKTSAGNVEKDITIPEGGEVDKIEKVSLKNNILEIKLKKKKEVK
ncbi:MAG: hypothetical protein KKG75_01210 [Nanoarchaeota archaeon]|nr:hypothetical protein [Nanoarchaeota archaeon]